jgi:hypothetical protein
VYGTEQKLKEIDCFSNLLQLIEKVVERGGREIEVDSRVGNGVQAPRSFWTKSLHLNVVVRLISFPRRK